MIEKDDPASVTTSSEPDPFGVLRSFEGTPDAFLARLLDALILITGAGRGAILRLDESHTERIDVVSLSPALPGGSPDPLWLKIAAQGAPSVAESGSPCDRPLGDGRLVLAVLGRRRSGVLVGALVLDHPDARIPVGATQILGLSGGLVDLYDARRSGLGQQEKKLRTPLELVAAMGEQPSFRAAALATANEAVDLFDAQRVGLGFLHGRVVRLEALSHTEKINRSSEMVRTIESAMEESLDQDTELLAGPDGPPNEQTAIARDTIRLARLDAGAEICSLPIRRDGAPVGVLCLERSRGEGWSSEDVQTARLACELVTPRLIELRERDRWLGARMAASTRRALAVLIGTQHTWIKLTAIVLLGVAILAAVIQGPDYASAPFVVRAPAQRLVAAPFDGFLEGVHAFPGDRVESGATVLAQLSTTELELQLGEIRARVLGAEREASIARREGKEAEAQVAEAQAREAQALVDLLSRQLESARIVSPIDGQVVEPDLRSRIGGAVKRGEPLFLVVPDASIEAELVMSGERIAEVEEGMDGSLATLGFPGKRIPIVVDAVAPAGRATPDGTVFVVRARLLERPNWLRPGMEGVARVHLGDRSYGWIWTRRFVNWVRLKLWI